LPTQVTLTLPEPLYERAEQLARLRQQDVAAVLKDVLDDTLPPVTAEAELFDLSESDDALDREMVAYIAMHPMLKEKYFGKHVAVYGGQLIDYDEDFEALYERVRKRYPDQIVWMSTVKDEPIETIYVRSPRWSDQKIANV
jgi:hypothetical protein